MSLPFAASLCHACTGCRAVVSGRGSVFLRCDRRETRYPPQPVRACPVFDPRPRLRARSDRGVAIIAWRGPAAAFEARVEGARLIVDPAPPRPTDVAIPGDALIWQPTGLALTANPTRGPALGWVLAGRDALAGLADGAIVTFTPDPAA